MDLIGNQFRILFKHLLWIIYTDIYDSLITKYLTTVFDLHMIIGNSDTFFIFPELSRSQHSAHITERN